MFTLALLGLSFIANMSGPPPFLFGPSSNPHLCVQPAGGTSAAAGATLVLEPCETADNAQFWSWSGVIDSTTSQMAWVGNPTLCIDIGSNANAATAPTLQACNPGSQSQQWYDNPTSGVDQWSVDLFGPIWYLSAPVIASNFTVLLAPGGGVPGTSWTRR